jgi:DNA-directed RNA polymerase subunit delta
MLVGNGQLDRFVGNTKARWSKPCVPVLSTDDDTEEESDDDELTEDEHTFEPDDEFDEEDFDDDFDEDFEEDLDEHDLPDDNIRPVPEQSADDDEELIDEDEDI